MANYGYQRMKWTGLSSDRRCEVCGEVIAWWSQTGLCRRCRNREWRRRRDGYVRRYRTLSPHERTLVTIQLRKYPVKSVVRDWGISKTLAYQLRKGA